MKNFLFLSLVLLSLACNTPQKTVVEPISQQVASKITIVKTNTELANAIKAAVAGEEIVLTNGIWKDVAIEFTAKGTAEHPIILRAETAGKVSLEGQSYIKFGGEYLTISGLHFKNGYTPEKAIIIFKLDEETIANHCRVTNCVIENFNQPRRDKKDHWVEFWGRHNQLDHCYLAGKSNEGPTVRVDIKATYII